MNHIKTIMGAGVLALGTAFSAAADDLVVTKECAEEALKSTVMFGQAVEIGNEENGFWAMTHYDEIDINGKDHKGSVSAIISLDASNAVQGISGSVRDNENTAQADLNFDQENPKIIVTLDGETITPPPSPSIVSDLLPSVAAAVVSKLDEKLRECAQPQILSMNTHYPPFKLG